MGTTTQDAEHLKLLSIFHYIVAGLAALFACLPFLHLLIGVAMVTGWHGFADQDPMAGVMGWFFIVFAGVFILAGQSPSPATWRVHLNQLVARAKDSEFHSFCCTTPR